jgi:hypothetical protein
MVMDFVPGGELFTLLRRSNVSKKILFTWEWFWNVLRCRDFRTLSQSSMLLKWPSHWTIFTTRILFIETSNLKISSLTLTVT